jgi:hypothetical protein
MKFEIVDTWEKVNNEIIKKHINNMHYVPSTKTKDTFNEKEIHKLITEKLNNKLYKNLDNDSCKNTIKYIFYKIRAGIFVKIENNKLEAFIPFANKFYQNNWNKNIKFYNANNLKEYIKKKKEVFRYSKNYLQNPKYWWANAYIINNEYVPDVWGQHSLLEYYNIIIETLKNHQVKNCIFFINKRDHPILTKDLYEPYLNFYPKKQKIENQYFNKQFIPILSPYTNKDYLDIPFIIPQDWQLATNDENYYKINSDSNVEWKDKKSIAFFRGSATGSMEIKYNQRLQISKLDYEWKTTKPNLLDAGIVSWNPRDKIDSKLQVNFINPEVMKKENIYLKERVPMNEQIKYKYIINIDGHSNPNRTSYLLHSGCLILMVESKYVIGNICWYTDLLEPYVHYIPVKFDLSDLEDQIKWCIDNDDECCTIVQNANNIYKEYFNKNKLLEYSAYIFNKISNNFK